MEGFEIRSVVTSAELPAKDGDPFVQWADISFQVRKDFDWQKNGGAVLKRLEFAASLIGRGES
jgi:hypothetical protein